MLWTISASETLWIAYIRNTRIIKSTQLFFRWWKVCHACLFFHTKILKLFSMCYENIIFIILYLTHYARLIETHLGWLLSLVPWNRVVQTELSETESSEISGNFSLGREIHSQKCFHWITQTSFTAFLFFTMYSFAVTYIDVVMLSKTVWFTCKINSQKWVCKTYYFSKV